MKKLPTAAPLPKDDEKAHAPTDSNTPKASQNQLIRHFPAVSFTGRPGRKRRRFLPYLIMAPLLLLLAYSAGTLILYARLAPQLSDLGIAEADREIRLRINREVLAMCEAGELNGEKMMAIRRDRNGKVVSLEVDAAQITRMQSILVDRLTEALEDENGFTLSVPAGSLTSSGILSWMSFPVRVKYTPLGAVSGEIRTDFSGSGVNQTRYSVYAMVHIRYMLLLPGENPRSEAETVIPLGEIIIVGDVPQWYGANR